MKNLVVYGGSGFLGQAICKQGVKKGWSVTAVSRHGRPKLLNHTKGNESNSWVNSVEWIKRDLSCLLNNKDKTNQDPHKLSLNNDIELPKADAVVCTLGILLESNYKGKSPITALMDYLKGANPMNYYSSYAYMNRDLPVALARAYSSIISNSNTTDIKTTVENNTTIINNSNEINDIKKDIKNNQESEFKLPFVYMSAAGNFPIVPDGYFNSKKQAEEQISLINNLRPIFMRPGFMYDSSKIQTEIISIPVDILSKVDKLAQGRLSSRSNNGASCDGILGAACVAPLSRDMVASAILNALENESIDGVITAKQIQELGA